MSSEHQEMDSTNGNGKLIVHALGSPNDENFYVNDVSPMQEEHQQSNLEISQHMKRQWNKQLFQL